jgi:hypothetical protein
VALFALLDEVSLDSVWHDQAHYDFYGYYMALGSHALYLTIGLIVNTACVAGERGINNSCLPCLPCVDGDSLQFKPYSFLMVSVTNPATGLV